MKKRRRASGKSSFSSKGRKSSSGGMKRSSGGRSKSAFGSRRKSPKGSSSQGLFGDIKNLYKKGRRKQAFVKPSVDPGQKPGAGVDYSGSGEELLSQSGESSGSGCGCCSSIGGLITMVTIAVIAGIIILIVKCSGC